MRSFSSAAASFLGVLARIISRTIGSRSGARNMCSVRHRPMPSAPSLRALAASSPVSALARTASLPLRIASAHCRIVSNSAGGLDAAMVELADHDVAGGAVERQPVALLDDRGADGELLAVDLDRVGADDGRGAPTTGDDGGVADQATAGGEDALRRHHAVHVFGARLTADEDDVLALLAGRFRLVGGEVRPGRPRRPARHPSPTPSPCPCSLNCGCSTESRCSSLTRLTASSRLIVHLPP